MMEGIVTAIEPQRRRGGARVNVFVDGRYAFSLERDLAELVRVGEPISDLRSAELLLEDEQARALEAALVFLSYRPRSEREVRDRLRRKEVPEPILEAVIARLRQLRYLDDEAFARYWVEQRQSHRPRGSRLLRLELGRKGIARETSVEVLDQLDQDEDPVAAACRAAEKRARALRLAEEREFTQKIGQFLLRRGFDYETARAAARRLWIERQ
jgi:regulatory protein